MPPVSGSDLDGSRGTRVADEKSGRPAGTGPPRALTWIVGFVSLAVYALHGFSGLLTRDLAVYAYAAQRVVEGIPPYVGILNRAGPLAHLVPALGVAGGRLLSMDDLLAMRLFFLMLSVVCVCLVYVLVRNLCGSHITGLAAASWFLSFYGFINYATYGPREKTTVVLLLLLLWVALTRRQWGLAAAMGGMAALVWQPAAFVVVVALVTPLIGLRGSDRGRAAIHMVVGGMVPVLITLTYFTSVGALRDLLDAYVLINLRYTTANSLGGRWSSLFGHLQRGYGFSLWPFAIGLAALTLAAVVRVRTCGWRESALDPVVIAGYACAPAFLWTWYEFDSWPDVFFLLPFAAIGLGSAFSVIMQWASTRNRRGVTAVALILPGLLLAVNYSVTQRDQTLDRQRESVEHVLSQLPPDATMLSVQAPQALVLSGRKNLTRYQMFGDGLNRYVDDRWPGGIEAFARWVRDQQPTVVVRQPTYRGSLGGLRQVIERDYRRVGRAPGWVWYVHRSQAVGVTAYP